MTSEVPLALPTENSLLSSEPAVQLRNCPSYFVENSLVCDDWFTSKTDGEYTHLKWQGIGEFAVHADGCEILYSLDGRTPWSVVQAYLLNQVLSTVLLRRGLESLHGVACEVRGRAYLFLGNTRMGKSTLLTQLVQDGARFVSDDLLVLSRNEGELVVHRGLPRFKLYPDAIAHTEILFDKKESLSPYTEKTLCVLPQYLMTEAAQVPIERIFVLQRGNEFAVENLRGTKKFTALSSNIFNTLDFANLRRATSLSAIAHWNDAKVCGLTYPHSFAELPRFSQQIREEFL